MQKPVLKIFNIKKQMKIEIDISNLVIKAYL